MRTKRNKAGVSILAEAEKRVRDRNREGKIARLEELLEVKLEAETHLRAITEEIEEIVRDYSE